jgi:uncharacterized protein YjeT (DUF2065 family)
MMLHLAWMVMTFLRFAGVVVVFAGVGLFGVYFIGENGRSRNGTVPRSSWLGDGPKNGMRIFGLGLLILSAAFVLSRVIPDGT